MYYALAAHLLTTRSMEYLKLLVQTLRIPLGVVYQYRSDSQCCGGDPTQV